jgi:hypothetical protein
LTFKEKRTIHRERIFEYENGDEPIANSENRFRIQYFNLMVNEIKSNLQTQFELLSKSVNKFGFF